MPEGIEIYDPAVGLVWSTGDNAGRGIGYFDTGAADGSITVSLLAGQQIWVSCAMRSGGTVFPPEITINQSTGQISWVYSPYFGKVDCRILYGVY